MRLPVLRISWLREHRVPTALIKLGWRLYLYSNEGSEPVHVHCVKGDKECKFWLNRELFEIELSFMYNMNNKDLKQSKKIIYENFDYLYDQWNRFHRVYGKGS